MTPILVTTSRVLRLHGRIVTLPIFQILAHLRLSFTAFISKLALILVIGPATFFTTLPQVMATSYYVSPSGNDGHNGLSPQAAWATLDRVNQSQIQPGDQILLEGGKQFYGSLYFQAPRVGTSSNPIVISSYGQGKAIIEAQNSFGIMVQDGAGFSISNLHIRGKGLAQNQSYGILFRASQQGGTRHSGIYLDSLEVEGFRWGGIQIENYPNSADPLLNGFRDIYIMNCASHDNGDAGIQVVGGQLEAGYSHANVYIGYCQTYRNVGAPGKYWSHTGNGIVVGNTDSVLIEHCIAYENGANNSYTGGGPVGIWLWDSRDGIIQFCESHHNQTGTLDGGGFDLDGGCVDCVMQYNYAHDNDGAGYLIAAYPNSRPIRNSLIRFNISQNDGRAHGYGAIHIWKASGSQIDRVRIYHNTLYLDQPASGRPAVFKLTVEGVTGIEVYNNAFISRNGVRLVDIHQGSFAEVTMQYNAYYAHDNQPTFQRGSRIFQGISDWQTGTGQELNNGLNTAYIGHPGLSNLGHGGTLNQVGNVFSLDAYRPYPDSPLPGRGKDLSQTGEDIGPIDFFMNPIKPGNRMDIGAGVRSERGIAHFEYDHWTESSRPRAYALGEGSWKVLGLAPGIAYQYEVMNMGGQSLQTGFLGLGDTVTLSDSIPNGYYWLRLEHANSRAMLGLMLRR